MRKRIPAFIIQRDVDQANIAINAGKDRMCNCPVSQAMRRIFPGKSVSTGSTNVTLSNGEVITSSTLCGRALRAINEFDLRGRVQNLPLPIVIEFDAHQMAKLGIA